MLLLCDTNGLAYRSYFTSSLTTSEGVHVAIPHYGIKTMWYLLDRFKPASCIAVWDGGRSPARMHAYPDYKAKREESRPSVFNPEFFYGGCDMLSEGLTLLGVPTLKIRHVEADDIIANICFNTNEDIMIVTTDKDFYQLVSQQVSLYSPTKDEVIDIGNFKSKTGYKSPHQFLQVRILTGDASDNIVGIRGVGPKTALKFVESGKSLYNQLKEKSIKTKRGYTDSYIIRRNTYLMDLKVNPDKLKIDDLMNQMNYGNRNVTEYKQFLHRLEFNYLYSMLHDYMPYFERLQRPELKKGESHVNSDVRGPSSQPV